MKPNVPAWLLASARLWILSTDKQAVSGSFFMKPPYGAPVPITEQLGQLALRQSHSSSHPLCGRCLTLGIRLLSPRRCPHLICEVLLEDLIRKPNVMARSE